MGVYKDGDAGPTSHSYDGSATFNGGDPTKASKFNALIGNDKLFLSSKMSIIPGCCSDGVTVVRESGGAFWVWTYFGAGDSNEASTRTLIDVSRYNGIVPPSVYGGDDAVGMRYRMIYVRAWCYTAEKLSESAGDEAGITYRMPGQKTGDGNRYDYEALKGTIPLLADYSGTDVGFYSGVGDDDTPTGNYRGVIDFEDTAGVDVEYTFWAHEDSGDLMCNFDYTPGALEYHGVLVAKIRFMPKMT